MDILSSNQIHNWDQWTIRREPIASLDLMERAAGKATQWLVGHFSSAGAYHVFCGKGNNGGDGLAIARQLLREHIKTEVYVLENEKIGSCDFQQNLIRLREMNVNVHFIQDASFFPSLKGEDIVVDALFGSGLNRPILGLGEELVNYLNQSQCKIVSIDIPSGLYCDKSSIGNAIVKASYTLTFQVLKLCFLIEQSAPYAGKVEVLNIGLAEDFLKENPPVFKIPAFSVLSKSLKDRSLFDHKGRFGHSLIIAGSLGKMGACWMASKAGLRSGSGRLTAGISEDCLPILQMSLPEAMTISRKMLLNEQTLSAFTAIGMGPGMGLDSSASELLHYVLQYYKRGGVVLDADAITLLSEHKDWLSLLTDRIVLTPHPGEFTRLFGDSLDEFERIKKAVSLSAKYPFVLVLKGHFTLIAYQGKGYFNHTGGPALAKGGSGDVLTGIITALLAQGYSSLKAALLGVLLHGMAGDIAVKKQSEESLIASDLIQSIGTAFNRLRNYRSI